MAPLVKIVIDEIRKACKKHPIACGFNPSDNAYEPLKLMQTVMAKTNEVCLRYLDNIMLSTLPLPGPPYNVVSVCAVKNTRRRMEDRHVVIHDLNTMFSNKQEASPSSYYAIFDGHAGHDAATYSAAHLHQYLAESEYFLSDPEKALKDAFKKTDELFIEKCNVEHFSSGTTAVCALLKPKEKCLYVAWVGDSQALLVKPDRVLQIVNPHKPCREDEKLRIEQEGGAVIYWGTWRVNGQLAVSRAIGDSEYKPYVSAVPDVREIQLDGDEDFLILACDGLWDFLSEDEAACTVYKLICKNPDDTDYISQRLVQLSKQHGSCDNISVIVVFLREPSKIAAEARWANRNGSTMDTSLDNANATTNNLFVSSNGGADILSQKDNFLLNLSDGFNKQNGSNELPSPASEFFASTDKTNGKRSSEFDDDDDLGPETNVDMIDNVTMTSPASEKPLLLDVDVKKTTGFNPFDEVEEKEEGEVQEKASKEIDLDQELKKQFDVDDDDRSPRDETPTPPADEVHDVVVGGVVENIAEESGDDSEDEWNYFKGDSAQKGPDKEVADIIGDTTDTMSQLNPDAAEFVPVSPTRSVESPILHNLLNDKVLAQSPSRGPAREVDIKLPNALEFESEVKSRPSDMEQFSNDHDHNIENGHNLSSKEIMNNLLNCKNIDEIDFQPLSGATTTSPNKNAIDEFHFGPNAAPFTPAKILDQSEALSTKAVYGDDSSVTQSFVSFSESNTSFAAPQDELSAIDKLQGGDAMSLSVYEKNDDVVDLLNTVQVLPDNIDDDCLGKPNATCDNIISGLPNNPFEMNGLKTTDLDSVEDEGVEVDKKDDFILCDVTQVSGMDVGSKSPQPMVGDGPHLDVPNDLCQRPNSKSPILESLSPEPIESTGKSTPDNDLLAQSISPVADVCRSPGIDVCRTPEFFVPSKSPAPVTSSPDLLKDHVGTPETDDLCRFDSDPIGSPVEDITSSIKDEASPVPPEASLEKADQILEVEPKLQADSVNFAQEISNAIEENIPIEPSHAIEQQNFDETLIPNLCQMPTPRSPTTDRESIATIDVISFLDRSDVPTVASPLSSTNEDDSKNDTFVEMSNPMLNKCEYPLPNNNFVDLDSSKTDDDSKVKAAFPAEINECGKSELVDNRVCSPVYGDSEPRVLEINEPTSDDHLLEPVQQVLEPQKVEPESAPVIHQEEVKVETAAAGLAATGAVLATAAAIATADDKKVPKAKPSATSITKKPAVPKTSPTKPATSKLASKPTSNTAATKTASSSTTTKPNLSSTSKVGAVGSKATTKPIPPKPAVPKMAPKAAAATSRLAERKPPLTNGDAKSPRTALTMKKSNEPVSPKSTTSIGKASPSSKPAGTRPSTAPIKSTTTAGLLNQPPKPKPPTSLSARTAAAKSTVTSSKSTTTTRTATASTARTSVMAPKARATATATATASARAPLTKPAASRGPATEKQIKETVNKQITASRITSATGAARNVTSRAAPIRKTETKTIPGTARTTNTKTSVTTLKTSSTTGKRTTVTETTATKTKTSAKPQENGVSMIETITTTVVTTNGGIDSQLLKDNSPVDANINNAQMIPEANAAD